MNEKTPPAQVWPTLRARDARALIRFLVDAFGFEETVVYGDGDRVHHAQLSWPAGGGIMLGSAPEEGAEDSWRAIERRKSRQIHVGNVAVGGDAPITVQSMTNTITGDAKATIEQIRQLEEAGIDIVRVSCPDEAATAAMPEIVKASKVPIVADIHFHYKRAIEAADSGAACLRINPGNIGSDAYALLGRGAFCKPAKVCCEARWRYEKCEC